MFTFKTRVVADSGTQINFEQLATFLSVEDWHQVSAVGEPGFQNGWANYLAGFANIAFRKDPFGFVHLRGLVRNGIMGTPIFNLPAGYRPAAGGGGGTLIFAVLCGNPGDALGRVDVLTNGDVQPQSGGNAYQSLSGISFRADA